MQTIALFACLVAAVSANGMGGHGYGMMGYNNNGMMSGGMMGNMMGGNMMGGNMMGGNMMGGNMMGGNNMVMQNMLSQILQGMMRNNMGNNMGGDSSEDDSDDEDDKKDEMMEKMFMMMFEKLMKEDGKKMDDDDDDKDMGNMEEMKALKEWYDMTRMADKMMVYMDYRKNEAEFVEAMSHLCLMVNATISYTMKVNGTMYNSTTDAEMEQLEKEAANWSDERKAEYVIDLLKNDQDRYGEMFFRFAMWGCQTGEKYAASGMLLERMMRGGNAYN